MKRSLLVFVCCLMLWNFSNAESPREKLFDDYAAIMIDVLKPDIQGYKEVFQNMIKSAEQSDASKTSKDFQKYLDKFIDAVKNIEGFKEEGQEKHEIALKLYTLYKEIAHLVNHYSTTNSRLLPEEYIFVKLLVDSGVNKIKPTYYTNEENTSMRIKELVGGYLNSLTAAEKEKNAKMSSWLEQDIKYNILEKWFTFFDFNDN